MNMENSRMRTIIYAVDILLRVPIFFVMDVICSSKHCFTVNGWLIFVTIISFIVKLPTHLRSGTVLMNIPFPSSEEVLYFLLHIFGFFASFILFFQRSTHLLSLYMSVAAVGVIIWSYILNEEYVKYCSKLLLHHSSFLDEIFSFNNSAIKIFLCNYISQTLLGMAFCFSTMNLPLYPPQNYFFVVLFVFPTIINAALPSIVLTSIPVVVAVIPSFVLAYYFLNFISKFPKYIWLYFVSLQFSFQVVQSSRLISFAWREYHVSRVLQIYGIARLMKDLIFLVYDDVFTEYLESGSFTVSTKQVHFILQILLIKSCENIIAICGITSLLSAFVDRIIYKPLQKFLTVPKEEEKSISSVFSQALIILTLQHGVTTLKPEERLLSIIHISMLMGTIILHQIHLQTCTSILTTLSVMGNLSFSRHLRALVGFFTVVLICYSWMTFLLKKYSFNPWLVPVNLFNIEIMMSLIISFIIYILNMIHLHSHKLWYEVYDYIYYLDSTKNVIIFFLGVFLFIKGIYTTITEIGSMLKVFILFAHYYRNIRNSIICAWKSVKQRWIIANCVNSLLIATKKETDEVGGLCAICYEDIGGHITSITRCNHFFHSYCLKKWLCERRICPMCQRIILHEDESDRAHRLRNNFHVHQE